MSSGTVAIRGSLTLKLFITQLYNLPLGSLQVKCSSVRIVLLKQLVKKKIIDDLWQVVKVLDAFNARHAQENSHFVQCKVANGHICSFVISNFWWWLYLRATFGRFRYLRVSFTVCYFIYIKQWGDVDFMMRLPKFLHCWKLSIINWSRRCWLLLA